MDDSKMKPTFPLLRDDLTPEQLTANIEYCRAYRKRLRETRQRLEKFIARQERHAKNTTR